jgi:outer membrane protein TolC
MSKSRIAACLLLTACAVNAQQALTLEQCISYALEHSRDLAKRELSHQGQQFTTMIERGRFRPILRAEADHELDGETTGVSTTLSKEMPAGINLSGTVRGEDNPLGTDSASAAFTVSKQILGGGSYRASMLDIDNSILEELVRLNLVHRYRRELAFRVRRSYYRLIRDHQTRRINELRVERAKKNLEFALERQDPLDIATARNEVPDNQAAVLRAERQIETTLDELKELIGMDIREELQLETDFQYEPAEFDVDADIAYCYANDEEILNNLLDLEKLQNELPVSIERRWPKVTVSASSQKDDDGGLNLNGDSELLLALSFSWELGGITQKYRVQKLQADIATQIIDIEDIRQAKVRQIRDLARRLRETEQLVELQKQKVDVAELRAELYRDRWQNGEIDILEYIRSQNDLENSRIQLINQQTTYMDLLGEYTFTVGR